MLSVADSENRTRIAFWWSDGGSVCDFDSDSSRRVDFRLVFPRLLMEKHLQVHTQLGSNSGFLDKTFTDFGGKLVLRNWALNYEYLFKKNLSSLVTVVADQKLEVQVIYSTIALPWHWQPECQGSLSFWAAACSGRLAGRLDFGSASPFNRLNLTQACHGLW